MFGQLAAHIVFFAHTGDHHGGRDRDQQRRNLGHQRIADRQQHIGGSGLGCTEVMLGHADDETAHDSDKQNQQTRDRIAAHKFGGTVHGAKKVGLFTHLGTAAFGFFFVDEAGIHVGVNGHLFARHGVQGETCTNFGDTFSALGHHHEIDDHENGKHNQTDGEIATNQEVPKGFNHRPCRARTGMALQQHHTG